MALVAFERALGEQSTNSDYEDSSDAQGSCSLLTELRLKCRHSGCDGPRGRVASVSNAEPSETVFSEHLFSLNPARTESCEMN